MHTARREPIANGEPLNMQSQMFLPLVAENPVEVAPPGPDVAPLPFGVQTHFFNMRCTECGQRFYAVPFHHNSLPIPGWTCNECSLAHDLLVQLENIPSTDPRRHVVNMILRTLFWILRSVGLSRINAPQ